MHLTTRAALPVVLALASVVASPAAAEPLKDRILTTFDHRAWHTLRVDVTPGDVKVTLDGEAIFDLTVSDRKAFDGKLCLFVQEAAVEWRDLEVKR